NARGVAGVAWKAQIMLLKVFDASGNGSDANAALAIDYSVSKGATVSSNSWGGGGFSSTLYTSIQNAGSANELVVAAARKHAPNNDTSPFSPASYDLANIVSVAATDNLDHLSWFSNYGATTVDLGAPGSSILSTYPNNS